jgi:hypothetical protein
MKCNIENKELKFKQWDKLELCKGLKGNLDEKISSLYEYRQ